MTYIIIGSFFLSDRVLVDYLDAFVTQHLMWTMKKLSTKANDETWHVIRVHKWIWVHVNKYWDFSPIKSWIYQKGFLLIRGFCYIGDSGVSLEFELCDYVLK